MRNGNRVRGWGDRNGGEKEKGAGRKEREKRDSTLGRQHRILNERIKCDPYSLVFNQVILTSATCFVRMLMMTVSPTLTPPADQGDRLLHLTSKRVRRTSHDAVQHCRLY